MKIAIFDIDDTIVKETDFMLKYAPSFLRRKYNIDAHITNPTGYDLKEVYGLVKHFRQLGFDDEQAVRKADYINHDFWNRNFVKYCRQPIKNGVRETIEQLRLNGYTIIFLSLRGKNTENSPSFKERIKLFFISRLTVAQLRRGKIYFDFIRLVKNKEEKLEYIRTIKPTFVFEDRSDIIQEMPIDTKVFCVNTLHNQKCLLGINVVRLNSFDSQFIKSILEQNKEDELKRIKRYALLQKRFVREKSIRSWDFIRTGLTEFTYSMVRIIGSPIALMKYRPIVVGLENIPKKGPVIFAGNHRSKLDPVLIGATSPRSIHWGALLRMFQGRENLFSSTTNPILCSLSAAFITSMGAVPIARNTDADHLKINMESIRKLCQVLIWGGATGLFPEGTLNRIPEQRNILPLKSNRVFKMAMDTGSLIVPVSVVWIPKELKIKNKVIISYGLPINGRNRTSQEVSELWQQIVNCGIETAKKMMVERSCGEQNSSLIN